MGCVTPPTLLIGLGFIVLGVISGIQDTKLALKGTLAQGRVVSIEQRSSTTVDGPKSHQTGVKRPSVTYAPVVEFTSADGRPYRFVSSLGHGRPQHEVGQVVDIVYDPVNPQRADLRSATWAVGLAVLPVLVGLVLAAAGVLPPLIVWWRNRKAPQRRMAMDGRP